DAVVAVLGAARHHRLVPLRHQQSEDQGLGVAVGGVSAGIGGARRKVLNRPFEVGHITGVDTEEILALIRDLLGLGLERPGVTIGIGAGRAARQIVGPSERVGLSAGIGHDGLGFIGDRRLALGGFVREEVLAGIGVAAADGPRK